MKRLTTYFFHLHKVYNRFVALFINYDYAAKKNPTLSKETIKSYNNSRLFGPKKIICFAPFNHMHLGVDGIVSACCINKKSVYGTLENTSIKELMQSDSINDLRTSIENYNLSDGCLSCQRHLETGNYKTFLGRLYDPMFSKKEYAYPTEMTFEISNTCNLECIMCDGNFSSSIRKNREQLPPLKDKYTTNLLDKIKPAIPFLKVVHFQGGEPFLIDAYYDLLEYIIKHNSNCKIYIQTNGTVLNQRVKKIIEHKSIHLSISIDSLVKEQYEFIRKNASFIRLSEHMSYFINRSIQYGQKININFCLMNNNWMEVPEIIAYCNKNNFTITIIPVESPIHLSIKSFENHQLHEMVAFYEQNKLEGKTSNNIFNAEKLEDLINSIKSNIQKNELMMTESEERKKKLIQYKEYSFDELRNVLKRIFVETIFTKDDIDYIFKELDKHLALQHDEAKKIFIITILTDQNKRTYQYLLNVYQNNKNWKEEFEDYFLQIPLRMENKIVVNL